MQAASGRGCVDMLCLTARCLTGRFESNVRGGVENRRSGGVLSRLQRKQQVGEGERRGCVRIFIVSQLV